MPTTSSGRPSAASWMRTSRRQEVAIVEGRTAPIQALITPSRTLWTARESFEGSSESGGRAPGRGRGGRAPEADGVARLRPCSRGPRAPWEVPQADAESGRRACAVAAQVRTDPHRARGVPASGKGRLVDQLLLPGRVVRASPPEVRTEALLAYRQI